jgi:hypothetical protein
MSFSLHFMSRKDARHTLPVLAANAWTSSICAQRRITSLCWMCSVSCTCWPRASYAFIRFCAISIRLQLLSELQIETFIVLVTNSLPRPMPQHSDRTPICPRNPEEATMPLIDHGSITTRARQLSEEAPESLPGSQTSDCKQATTSDPPPLFNLDPKVIDISGAYVVITVPLLQ